MTVDDDETLGVVISPTALTVQAGGSNSYTVVLGSLPSGDVTVTLSGHEGAVLSLAGIDNDNALTFTQDNWHAPQTVSVSADAEAQSSTITIEHSVASADDPDYAAAAAPDVAVSVLGAPDTIQIQVGVATSVQELEVPEGGANTYSMVLSHQPSGDVTVTVNNPTDNSEVTATPRTLTFTTENWHAPQTVTVAAVHDGDAADDSATVTHGVADGGYNGVTVPDVAVTVDDDETVSIVLSKTDLTVEEEDADRRDLHGEAVPRAVGRGDGDGDRPGHHGPYAERSERDGHPDLQHDHLGRCADGDGEGQRGHRRGQRLRHPDPHGVPGGEYEGVAKSDLAVTVDDDETVSIASKTTGGGGGRRRRDLHGEAVPRALREVTVTVTGQDHGPYGRAGQRHPDLHARPPGTAQTVTVKAGPGHRRGQRLHHPDPTGAGGEYEGVSDDLAVTVDDDETVSIVLSKTTLTVEEEDADGETYTVKLSHEPSVEVTVTVTGQDTTDLTLSGLSGTDTLTFSTTTWDDAQTVTVKAREDTDAKNDSVTLTHTGAGGEYEGVAEELAVTVDDDETVSIVLSKTDGSRWRRRTPRRDLHGEAVPRAVGRGDGDGDRPGHHGPGARWPAEPHHALTFTHDNWDDAQTVTVKAREDADAQNDSVTLTHTGAGGEYEGVAEELAVTVDDDETLGVVISPTALTVQAGGSNSYTVVLGSLPSGDVTVTLSGHEGAVLSLAGIDNDNALTFTQDNWHAPQTVSVSADAEAQSSTITIEHSVASADDPDYAAAAAPDVAVSVLGAPDTIQIQVGVATSVQELEVPEGGANTYSMVLSHQPSGDVTVTVNNPTDNSEVTATPRTLTFTTENWHAPQTVTVAAVHDGDAADDSATVTHGVADGGYNGVTVPDVAVTVDDDETVSIVLSKTDLTVEEEDADGGTYTVKLSHEPSVEVTVTVTGQDTTDLDAERSERDGHPDLQRRPPGTMRRR